MAMTKRMEALAKRLFEVEYRTPKTWHFVGVNILDTMPEIKSEPIVVRKGYAQKYMGQHLPALVKADELIVGLPNQNSVGWGSVIPKYYTEEEGAQSSRYDLNECSVWGHHPPDWGKTLRLGVSGVKSCVAAHLAKFEAEGAEQPQIDNLRAMLIALDGISIFAQRHAQAAKEAAENCPDPARKSELLEISDICAHVAEQPARGFHEAVQAFWFTYCLVNSGGEFVPLGRADQILYPYYERDIASGKLTKEQAADILASFLTKCNERIIQDTKLAENHYNFGLFSQGKPIRPGSAESGTNETGGYETRALTWQEDQDENSEANFNYGQSGNDWLMNCIVAGLHPDGTDATTDLSRMFVEIMYDMKLLMPTLAARVHKNTPPDFIDLLARVLRYGQGEPMIYNDDAIIPGFVDLGIPIEDARDYSNDGCWETLIPGKSHFSYAHVMNLRCVEWVFFRGVSQHNGKQEGVDTGDPAAFADFEQFYSAYHRQVAHYIDLQCQTRLDNFQLSYMIAPDPLMSSITDDCVSTGKDISQDGARYIFHQILVTGLSCTADSLMVVKKLVYDEKAVGISELAAALKNNWEGFELLRARAINKVPKFGNDEDEVDAIAVRILKDFERHVSTWNGRHEKILFPCGIGTFENYAALGRDIGATPDGRQTGDALASNYSPSPGADKKGPTAAIKSIVKPDLLKYYSGSPLDLSINSNEVTGEAGITRLSGMIRSFCELGGQIMTITSTNPEDLKDAKVNPDRHRGLRVRMGGLSAYFVAMSPVQQDNIIKRFSR